MLKSEPHCIRGRFRRFLDHLGRSFGRCRAIRAGALVRGTEVLQGDFWRDVWGSAGLIGFLRQASHSLQECGKLDYRLKHCFPSGESYRRDGPSHVLRGHRFTSEGVGCRSFLGISVTLGGSISREMSMEIVGKWTFPILRLHRIK